MSALVPSARAAVKDAPKEHREAARGVLYGCGSRRPNNLGRMVGVRRGLLPICYLFFEVALLAVGIASKSGDPGGDRTHDPVIKKGSGCHLDMVRACRG